MPFGWFVCLKSKSGQSFTWNNTAGLPSSPLRPHIVSLFKCHVPRFLLLWPQWQLSSLSPSLPPAPPLSRGLEFSEVIPEALGFKTATLNDTQGSRTIARPLQVAIAINLGRPKGKWTLGETRDKENRTQCGPARLQFAFPSPSLHILQGSCTTLVTCRDWHAKSGPEHWHSISARGWGGNSVTC